MAMLNNQRVPSTTSKPGVWLVATNILVTWTVKPPGTEVYSYEKDARLVTSLTLC